jgi:propanol-preferring alcohol dehydrogenase
MKAMILSELGPLDHNSRPLSLTDIPDPVPSPAEILVAVSACGVCHTEIDEIEGRTPPPRLPVVLGHQIVGTVTEKGKGADRHQLGDRVGIGWIYSSCGQCKYCRSGNENLCAEFRATGRDANGGYAEYLTIHEDFAFPIPEVFTDTQAAPLLCAGAIGFRSLRLTKLKNGESLGLTGFGASAHLVLQLAKRQYPDSYIYVFARSEKEQAFARELGAVWAGGTEDEPPQKLRAIIDTTPVYKPVVEALKNLEPGGRLVINAIRKEPTDTDYLTRIDYGEHLWMEKEIKSVANVSRSDIADFLKVAAEIPIKPQVQEFTLADANKALMELKQRKIRGAKVLMINP